MQHVHKAQEKARKAEWGLAKMRHAIQDLASSSPTGRSSPQPFGQHVQAVEKEKARQTGRLSPKPFRDRIRDMTNERGMLSIGSGDSKEKGQSKGRLRKLALQASTSPTALAQEAFSPIKMSKFNSLAPPLKPFRPKPASSFQLLGDAPVAALSNSKIPLQGRNAAERSKKLKGRGAQRMTLLAPSGRRAPSPFQLLNDPQFNR